MAKQVRGINGFWLASDPSTRPRAYPAFSPSLGRRIAEGGHVFVRGNGLSWPSWGIADSGHWFQGRMIKWGEITVEDITNG
jgi:hypothetical protein